MKPVIIIVIAFVLLIPANAFAAEGYWISEWGSILSHSPTVCFFQPNDPRIDESRWNMWYSDAKVGLDTWRTILGQSGNGNWDITIVEVPLDKADLLKNSRCDITIEFVEKPFIENGYYANALGWAMQDGTIKIVYSSFEYCGKIYNSDFDITVNSYCFSDNFTRSKQMANTVQHEFGHTLGLGHYRGYDSVSTQSWYDSGLGAPSIMAWMEPNEEVRQVSQNDVNRILDLYGSKGLKKNTNFTPIFNEPIIQEAIIPVAGLTNIHITDNSETKLISGYVPDKLFKRGTFLEILIKNPDGFVDTKATTVSKTRHAYQYSIVFDQSSQAGMYEISLRFDGTVFEKIPINVSKEQVIINHDPDGDGFLDEDDLCPNEYSSHKDSKGCPDTTQIKIDETLIQPTKITPNIVPESLENSSDKIPSWVKNNAKWWADGSIDDDSFVQGIQFLIKENILDISEGDHDFETSTEIPSWIKRVAEFWSMDMISEDDFIMSIQFLIENGIVKVN